jgi:hypothetical protein
MARSASQFWHHGARTSAILTGIQITFASGGIARMDLRTAITQFFNDARDIAQIVAPVIAVLGFLGLGIMYLGSSWPILGDWKRENPKAANQVVLGLLFLIFASSVTAIISFV